MNIKKNFTVLLGLFSVILSGVAWLVQFDILPEIEGSANFPTVTVVVNYVMPVLLVMFVVVIAAEIGKKVFPSDKPGVKNAHTNKLVKPWSGAAVLLVTFVGIDALITGIVWGNPGMKLAGLAVAIAFPVFSAPLMGEKAPLDYILEAADERAASEKGEGKKHK